MFFWLCQNCWSTMALRVDRHKGLAFVPKSGERDSRLTGLEGAEEYSAPSRVAEGQASQLA